MTNKRLQIQIVYYNASILFILVQLETIKMQLNHQLQAFQRESNDIHIELTELETKYRASAQNEQQKSYFNFIIYCFILKFGK